MSHSLYMSHCLHMSPKSFCEKWSENLAKSKDFVIFFDLYLGVCYNLARNDCAQLF